MMITAPHYFSKCPPLAAMHFTALAFMSNIALLTITGSICATSFVMLAWLKYPDCCTSEPTHKTLGIAISMTTSSKCKKRWLGLEGLVVTRAKARETADPSDYASTPTEIPHER